MTPKRHTPPSPALTQAEAAAIEQARILAAMRRHYANDPEPPSPEDF